jgi:hypothetical protein
MVSENLGLTSHKSSCNCTGCGMLRAGVWINCAEKTAALILESGRGEIAVEPCSGACREAIEPLLLHPARALARAACAMSAATASAALAFLASRAEAPPALSTAMASSRATIKERVSLASRRPKRLAQLPPSRHRCLLLKMTHAHMADRCAE